MRLVTFLQIFIILSVALPVFAGEIDDLKNEIEQRAKEIEKLQQEEDKYKGAISDAHQAADSLDVLVVDFNRQINKLEGDISIKENEIAVGNLKIRQTELEIEDKKEDIKRLREYIAATLRQIYENDDAEVIELIFKYDNFSEFFNQVEYRHLLQEDLNTRLEEIKELKSKLEQEKSDLDDQNEKLNSLKLELENRNIILNDQRDRKRNLLETTRNEEWRYRNLLKSTKENQDAIQHEIFELEDKLRQAIDESSIPAPRPGVLNWPTEGILSQGYGCTRFAKTSNFYPTCFHNGIDIAASYGTLIKSARDGKVLAVQNAPYAYGNWIAIEHDNGLVTLYGHLSLQSVSVGQEVSGGETLGYMGSTGFSTGSHLHFTVYAPKTFSTKPSTIAGTLPIGATLNPFDYLP